jgi:hypothetical protein
MTPACIRPPDVGQVVNRRKDHGAGVRGSLRPCRGRGPETAPPTADLTHKEM